MRDWINSEPIGDYYCNKMVPGGGPDLVVTNPATGGLLATIPTHGGSVGEAMRGAREAREGWTKMQGHIRARHLYR